MKTRAPERRRSKPLKRKRSRFENRDQFAETGGFEPPVEFNPDPSLAVKSIRPLWHVSIRYC
jgi:hypothetical protein